MQSCKPTTPTNCTTVPEGSIQSPMDSRVVRGQVFEMQPTMESLSAGEAESKNKIAELEQRYIRLLESRILQLEQRAVSSGKTNGISESVKSSEEDTIDNDSTVGVDGDREQPANDDANDKESKLDETETDDEPRYTVIVSRWDPETGDFKNVEATKKEEKKAIGPENRSRRAFTFRKLTFARNRRSESEPHSSEAKIEFEPLQRLLGKITSKWGWGEVVTTCSTPYKPLIYAWQEAMRESQRHIEGETEDEQQARTDLRELLNIISTSSGHLPLDRYFKDRATFLEEQTITHAALWTLFPPGTVIIARPFLDEPQVFTVSSCDGFVGERETFELVCFCFDWTGTEFTRVPFEMAIPYWGPDRRSIVELPFYPLQYYTDPSLGENITSAQAIDHLRSTLISRGHNFVKYCTSEKGKQMFKYVGDAHFHTGRSLLHTAETADSEDSRRSDDSSTSTGIGRAKPGREVRMLSRKKIDGTTMVDFDSFFEYLSPSTPILGNLRRYEGELESLSPERRANQIFKDMYKFHWDKHPPHREMTEDQFLHCPPRVLGYALKQKKWAQLLVKGLQAPDAADATVFEEKLQLDEEAKNLVKWSVQAHEEGKKSIIGRSGESRGLQDFAPDKGKGLVIMLYGRPILLSFWDYADSLGFPGVGKTLTAESVALMAGKPLLSVGVSDIGIEGDKVEANLQKVFDLAGRWEAVLLFDEADVFLEARGDGENDLRRNAMVSVLLRVLEYYDGILILTTNRMKSFDIAVQSRIHIAIKYDELDSEQQFAIFQSFLEQLKRKKLVEDYNQLITWAKKDSKKLSFNGRQIRNVVSTAMNIALVENKEGGGKLKLDHLIRVATQTKEFKAELKSQDEIYKAKTK
ncbi:aaa family atpase [Stemphylium lycopersici]|uniref:Aaa family atpase n=1 Tax=Stemphylium lycopersici TaxID=183478 RepID=A0A364ND03_STELY|nr:aaa family atpase [Stemphylium lycopersici]RAR10433.1 aaa family atpase [Stemphylium lycopersici]RAR15198.1 aaa family atpase [Stemphylium lycopersici]